jgi:hypothetical protein
MLIGELMEVIICSTLPECFRAYLDEMITIIRTLAMDPFPEVIKQVLLS